MSLLPYEKQVSPLDLGAFSISLAVKDLATPRTFYVKLGPQTIGGDAPQH